ncbi:hypothetical protein SAMN05519104_6932 [Rhizobiales bacterium GAS188]|nr:hypothetical protein SAMN05519104_6932 [Rhizobiales bacterium GAS188]
MQNRLVELAEITRSGQRKVTRAELADAIVEHYAGDAIAAAVGLIKIYLPLMAELREVTGRHSPAREAQLCPEALAEAIIREECDGDPRKAVISMLGMNLAVTGELRQLTGKRPYERSGVVH